ncbi:hypothetical protein [Streptomyces sp. NBC_00827]|uniref:hypothetical protein n=1 Tax=Streptomyces sp. NBC_00827 TaxID=2903677 RepID=UPI003866E00A|nr:hypothetical protein OG569_24015 [Streptomyces sp. NBC_00827]
MTDLSIPPTSNQAQCDLRPSKIQEKISGRLAGEDLCLISSVLSSAGKHLVNEMAVLRDAFIDKVWLPPAAAALT